MSINGRNIDDTLNSPRESRATQLGLDEELTVHDSRSGVERRAGDRWVDVVLSSDGVTVEFQFVSTCLIHSASENLLTRSRTKQSRAHRIGRRR